MKAAILSALLATLAAAAPAPFEIVSSRLFTELEERSLRSCPPGGTPPSSDYLKPTLMVPVSAKKPDFAFPATQWPKITPNDFCTIFNLEIPSTAVGKTCTLEFLFPNHRQTFSPYVYKGAGHFTFTGYAFDSSAIAGETTYNNQPPAGPSPPSPPAVLAPGNAYTINVGGCGIQAPE